MTLAPAHEPSVWDAQAWTGDAVDYDAWFDEPWGCYAFAVESAAVLRAARVAGGSPVLDAGCGTGRFGAALARERAEVVGIDPELGMIALATDRIGSRCARAVVEHPPFPDETFDLSVGVTLLEFVANPASATALQATRDRAPWSCPADPAPEDHRPWRSQGR